MLYTCNREQVESFGVFLPDAVYELWIGYNFLPPAPAYRLFLNGVAIYYYYYYIKDVAFVCIYLSLRSISVLPRP